MDELKNLSIDELTAAFDEAKAKFDEIIASDDASRVSEASELADLMDAIDAQKVEIETQEQAAADQLAALKDRKFGKDKAEAEAADEDPVEEEPSEEEPTDEAPVETPEVELVPREAPAAEAPAQVAAGSKTKTAKAGTSNVKTLANKRSRPAAPEKHASGAGPVSIVASASAVEKNPGGTLDMLGVAEEVLARAQSFGAPSGDGQGEDIRRFGTAKFAIDFPAELTVNNAEVDAEEVINFASQEANLPGGSLVASGGWCAPSETTYDLDQDATTEGMLSLPEVGIKRGGMRFAQSPTFADFYANPGFVQTEAQAISGTTKPCVEVNCPTFTDVRLDVEGLCIKVPILTEVGYPEHVKNFVAGTMIAHQHWINANVIGRVVTAAGTARVITGLGATVSDTLEALGLLIDERRQAYRLSLNASVEVILPFWFKNAAKADLARRNGRNSAAVTDAELNEVFTQLKANVQWVYDWQSLTLTANAYPTTVQALIYPAGTFVKGLAPVISLDTIYDAASLAVNTYTGLFTEQGFLVAKKKFGADLVTLPICNAGRQGALNLTCA